MSQIPTWFGPQDTPRFGWLHVPEANQAKGAVVCCPALGVEAVAGHRAIRELAVQLEEAGYLVLRFDYAGTGDSAGDPRGADELGTWRASIADALRYVRSCGASRVGMVGLRLGATMAAFEAQADGALDALVLWDPYVCGQAFVRAHKVLRETSVAAPPTTTGPDVEILGAVLSEELVGDLSALDLAQRPPGRPAARTLVLTREDRPVSPSLKDAFSDEWTQWGTARGQHELLDVTADLAQLPSTTIGVISWWLSQTLNGPPALVTPVVSSTAVVTGDTEVRERLIRLGPNELFGVRTDPVEPARGPVVVMLNAGLLHHVGPARLWVSLSRQLAAAGLTSVRVDIGGLGDSPRRPDQVRDVAYPLDAAQDIADVVAVAGSWYDAMPGKPNVVLVGVCSGAYHAIEAGIALGVGGVVAINPLLSFELAFGDAERTTDQPVVAQPLRPWIRRLARNDRLATFGEFRLPSPIWRLLDLLRIQRHPAQGLQLLAERHVPALVICGPTEARPLQRRASWVTRRLAAGPYLTLEVMPEIDHTLYGADARAKVAQRVTTHILSTFAKSAGAVVDQPVAGSGTAIDQDLLSFAMITDAFTPTAASDPPLCVGRCSGATEAARDFAAEPVGSTGPALTQLATATARAKPATPFVAQAQSVPHPAAPAAASSSGPRTTPRPALALVLLVASVGLLVQGIGYALGRSGHAGAAQTLFFVGLMAIFVPCAWRLLGAAAGRRERIYTSVALGCLLVLSCYLLSPTLFSGYDDLLHQTTLWQLADRRTLFSTNSLLPVSAGYPGLELMTLSIHWLSGLPLIVCELLVILISRIGLMLIVFMLAERLVGSPRAGSVAVVAYAASPQFYAFNAAYSYQTLALTLGAGAVYLLLRAIDEPERRRGLTWLSCVCLLGVVITHHLVSWLTVGALALWALVSYAVRRRQAARTIGFGAIVGLLLAAAWTVITATRLFAYLSPILGGATGGFLGLITGGNRRALFIAPAGPPTPLWQKAVLLVSTVVVLAALVASIVALVRNRSNGGTPLMRGGALRFVPIVIAGGYFVVLGSRLSSASEEVGGRMSTFVFFGIAMVFAAWFSTVHRRAVGPVALALASVAFLGGVLFGSGPSWSFIPGKYMPAADARSIDANAIAAAQWALDNVPASTPIAADRDNGALMAAIGHLKAVSEGTSGVNVGPLYFDTTWNDYDTSLVRRANIRYLVVDTRLAQGPPAFGTYFEPGETQGPEILTTEQLTKFDAVPGVASVYANGPIHIYDLSALLGQAPLTQSPGAAGVPADTSGVNGLTGFNWPITLLAALTAAAWLRRLRRVAMSPDRVIIGLVVSCVSAIVFALALVPSRLPTSAVATGVLGGLLLSGLLTGRTGGQLARVRGQLARAGQQMGHSVARLTRALGRAVSRVGRVATLLLRGSFWPARGVARMVGGVGLPFRKAGPTRYRPGRISSVIATALSVLIIGAAVGVSVVSERGHQHNPTALSVSSSGSGGRMVTVSLPGSQTSARLEMTTGAGVSVWGLTIPLHSRHFTVALPNPPVPGPATLKLVVDGTTLRTVSA
ncbi:MAG: glycosyltransferase family 39 protein [Actinomycetota bacterium]|nr:glycosyltransferase family 39 protein [Actinomycetota bacterium]